MLEEFDHFKYLGSQIGRVGEVKVDVSFRVVGATKAAGTVGKLWGMEMWQWRLRCCMRA